MTLRFEEVTGRFAAPVRAKGHPGDGLPMNVAVPSLGNVRIWQAVHGGYTWVIMHEPGLPGWSGEEKLKHVGYTASYRKLGHTRSSQTIRIDGAPWGSFVKAEEACKRTWKALRNAS
jgi:hypothetical protein